jgi:membrane protease YdiL (CAAX protease family)
VPRVDLNILQHVDTAMFVVGWLCVLAFGYVLARTGWRNPLASIRPIGGPELWWPFAIWLAPLPILHIAVDPKRLETIGSADWHTARLIMDVISIVLALFGIWLIARYRSFRKRRLDLRQFAQMASIGIPVTLASLAICMTQLQMCKHLWQWFAPQDEQPTHMVLTALEQSAWGGWGAVQLTVSAVIIAPLFEEILFRGLLLQSIWRQSRVAWPAVVISAVAFGLVHIPQPQDVLPLVSFGLILGYVRVRSGRLWLCVWVHSLFNLRTMALALLNPEMLNSGL